MKATILSKVKKGQFFKLKPTEDAPVWVRSDYNRELKKYEIYKYFDVNHYAFRKGNIVVYVDFYF